jgi:membrane protein implicated in regulation of membrane protease activity
MIFLVAVVTSILWLSSPWNWVVIVAGAILEIGETFFWLAWNRRRHAKVGVETLVGRRAVVVLPCRPSGQVRVDGELWQAECADGADAGQPVVIEQVDRLTLLVRPEG